MCIVTIKPKGHKLPKKNLLETCWENNDDGAGYMFVRDEQVYIRKGFMKFDEFYEDFKSMGLNRNDIIVFHFRISTSGGINSNNTHPFPLSAHPKDLVQRFSSAPIAMAHNGILANDGTTVDGYTISDTMEFIIDTLSYPEVYENLNNKGVKKLLEDSITGSRIVVLRADGSYTLLGDGWRQKGGLIHSNDGYIKRAYSRGGWRSYYSDFYSHYEKTDTKAKEVASEVKAVLEADYDEEEDKDYLDSWEAYELCPSCPNCATNNYVHQISTINDLYECNLCGLVYDENYVTVM